MKGEYDGILQWPFFPTFTIKLFNLYGGEDITDEIASPPHVKEFEKPNEEFNVGSGFSQFAGLGQLESGGYIKDDTLYIKVKVSTFRLFRP